ncbi:hypothetical protein AB0A63_25130 [Lentzea sp. NPDC042327]|uniref:hypothetical protein n=1 Tax=Lentzea sp. NPDC042327 TaxID=3154801 RepID=UPI0033D65D1F
MKAILSGPLGRTTHAVWSDQLCVARAGQDGARQYVVVDPDPDDDIAGTPLQRSLVESWFTLITVALAGETAAEVVAADGADLVTSPLSLRVPRSWRLRGPAGEFDRLCQVRVDHLSFLDEPPAAHGVSLAWGPPGEPDLDAIVDAITAELASSAPEGWTRISVECDATAGWQVLTTTVTTADGEEVHWLPSAVVSQWFHRLRAAGYSYPFGAWFTARYVLEDGGQPTLAFDTEAEPAWRPYFSDLADFAAQALRHEPTFYPRNPRYVPGWLNAALSTTGTLKPEPRAKAPHRPELLLARAVDGMSADGVALTYRTPVVRFEKQAVLDYLRGAPVVLSSRGLAPDLVDPEHPETVPMVFHTDGRWVWSGSVPHYLEHHDIAPDTALLAHIRANRYRPPDRLPSAVRARALATATGSAEEEPGLQEEFEQAASAALDIAAHLGLDPARYSVGEQVDGALCLVRVGDRYAVYWVNEDERRFYAEFDSPGDAATYLIGFFYSYAGSLQRA